MPDVKRCQRCNWPIVPEGEAGCWESNCSMRPMPPLPEARAQHPQAVEGGDAYEQFFTAIWNEYCDQGFSDIEDAEMVLKAGLKSGLVKEEAYDPDTHGNEAAGKWGMEKGDPYYIRAASPQPASVKRHLIFITQSENRWMASCDTITGLNIEADSKEQAIAEVQRWVPELIADNAYLISTSAVAIQKSGQNNEITMNGTERPIESLITKSENTQELADKVTEQYGGCQQPHPHMPPYTYSAGISIEALEGVTGEMEAAKVGRSTQFGFGLDKGIALLRCFIDGQPDNAAPSDKNAALRTVNGLGGAEGEKSAPPCGIIDGRGA